MTAISVSKAVSLQEKLSDADEGSRHRSLKQIWNRFAWIGNEKWNIH